MADSTNQNLFWWDRDDFLKLVPKTVQQQGDHLVLTAETRGQTWTIDFVNDQGQWKIDWVHGYTPRVVSDHPGATPTPTASTWQDRCNAVYRLGDNEILKRIAPPFISERKSYYAAAAPDQAERIPEPPTRIVFHWDGELRLLGMTFGGPPTLESVLNFALGLASFEYSGPDALLKREVTGDWIVRPDAPLPARVQALAHILTTALGRPIQFEKRPVEREVIVAKGTFTFGPLAAAQPTKSVHLFSGAFAPKDGCGGGLASLPEFLRILGNQIGIPVINQTHGPEANANYANHRSGYLKMVYGDRIPPDRLNSLLENVSRQTGLTFTREKRKVEVWFLLEK